MRGSRALALRRGLVVMAAALGGWPAWASGDAGADGAVLALRREYNEVAAAIDTLVRTYSVERFEALADPGITPGADLPEGSRLILLLWADDEARVYLNGAPVGETRLTPTRIEIPQGYLQVENTLTAQCWDTDRVESGFMAGLYVELGDGGLRPVLTTTEDAGWTAGSEGEPAQEIYYAHSQPDIPAAQVIWGPQLFGRVQLQVGFAAADVRRAARGAPVGVAPESRQATMDFHDAVTRLAGLQARREELLTRLQKAEPSAAHLRFRRDGLPQGPSFTLGQAAPLAEADQRRVRQDLAVWRQRLPAAQQLQLTANPRLLLGPQAATPAAPMQDGGGAAAVSEDRRADYRPPQDRGTSGEGGGGGSAGGSGGRGRSRVVTVASSAFLLRMGLLAVALAAWTGGAGWSSWRQWRRPSWEERSTSPA